MLDFVSRRTVIFGNNLTGKSNLAKWIASKVHPNFIWDYHGIEGTEKEYGKVNDFRYIPRFKDNLEMMERELDQVVNTLVIPLAKQGKIKLFIMDEASQYCPPKPSRLPASIRNLNDNFRHYGGMGIVFIARRPAQLNQDITELANNKFFFRLGGRADRQFEEDMEIGLASKIAALPPYHYVHVDEHGYATTHAPVGLI